MKTKDLYIGWLTKTFKHKANNEYWFDSNSTVEFTNGSTNYITRSYIDGKIHSKHEYMDNGRIEVLTGWHGNGKIYYTERYVNGELDGESKAWHYGGQIAYAATYKDGLKHGLSTGWSSLGNISSMVYYREGWTVKEIYWNRDGGIEHKYSS